VKNSARRRLILGDVGSSGAWVAVVCKLFSSMVSVQMWTCLEHFVFRYLYMRQAISLCCDSALVMIMMHGGIVSYCHETTWPMDRVLCMGRRMNDIIGLR
jgi:hypothetical protein